MAKMERHFAQKGQDLVFHQLASHFSVHSLYAAGTGLEELPVLWGKLLIEPSWFQPGTQNSPLLALLQHSLHPLLPCLW